MKMLGNSRGVASAIAVAMGLAVAPASAQIAPTAGTIETPPPPKPSAPAAPAPGKAPAPAPAKPATPPHAKTTKTKPAKPADPKALFASGDKKFKAGDYAGALGDFEASNTAKASPQAQRYIALSHDKLEQYPDAVAAFEKFIADPAANKESVEEAKKRLDEIKAMPGKVHVESTPAGAAITVDPGPEVPPPGGPAEGTVNAASTAPKAPQPAAPEATQPAAPTTPSTKSTPTDLELPAGKHTIRLSADGFESADKEIDVGYASKQDVRVELVKKEAPPPPPPPPVVAETPVAPPPPPPAPSPPPPRSKVPAYITGAVAVAAAGVGVGFGIAALSQQSDFNKNPTSSRADRGENSALVADMMFGVAITFGVTSAVLWFSNDQPTSAKATPAKAVADAKKKRTVIMTPTPYVTPSGGGAGLHVQF
ncbi:MAG: PEGA domain-containing protein [Polyangiaceae bacterium]|nr:PEGA domain-containing protein [Polyangiaceae bacterium]